MVFCTDPALTLLLSDAVKYVSCDNWRRLVRSCAPAKTQVSDREGDHGTQPVPKEVFFLVAVVAIQTTLTPPKYADAVALLLASIGPAWSLPGRLCIVGAVAVQWRVVLRSDTKDDRVGLVARHMDRAFRRRTQTLAELHDVQHVSATHYFQSVSDTGDRFFPRAPTILTDMSSAANVCTELREFRHHCGMKSISDFFFLRQVWPQS